MENASKALIIAGSILISIMLIALGVRIFYGAKNSADTTALDSTEITMFNQKFERFAGKKSGSNVKSMLSFAVSNASTNKDDNRKLPMVNYFKNVNDTSPNKTAKKSNIKNLGIIRGYINSTHTYTIKLEYAESGLVGTVNIYY